MISIVIPTFNEAETIEKIIRYLQEHSGGEQTEIIISDGGSADNTVALAIELGVITLLSPTKGRAAQMNHGAKAAKGDILYFIHADTIPPATYLADIKEAVAQGYSLGRYRTRFDNPKWLLKCNAFFTRFDWFICSGGDQTLFITKTLFDSVGGYDSSMLIMEDFALVSKARKNARYRIFSESALVSARKYETNSWLTVQLANKKIVDMYKKGESQLAMKETYSRLLNYRKSS